MEIYAVKILDISKEMINNICLSFDMKKRFKIEKLVNKKDKIRALIAEILIRTIIIEKGGISNNYIMFNRNQYGKPYLKGYPNFNFNISHSGDFVVCALDDKPIGIDIEEIRRVQYKEIAKNFFSVSEFDYIVDKDLDIQLGKFYEIWTLKESYIKCRGQGLSIPLESFSVNIDQYENIKVIANNEHMEYTFKRFEIESGYKMAICSLSKEIPNNIIVKDQNNLIRYYYENTLER